MQTRRCSILLIEPREKISFSPESLLRGGDGLDAEIELIALAPHLGREVRVSLAEAELLERCSPSRWSTPDESVDPEVLQGLLTKGLIVADDEVGGALRARDEALRSAHWQAHSAVSHYFGRWQGVTSGDTTTATMAELVEKLGQPPPPVLERVQSAARIGLMQTEPTPLDELLAKRTTCRNFDPTRSVDEAAFSHIMRRVFGAQAAYEIHADNIVIKRTSPSGGGLHPTEAYVLVQRVAGIAPGLYHYHPIDHALEPLPPPTSGDLRELASSLVAAQHYYVDAPVMIMLASRFPRMFWKYRNHSKAYRVAILDAGHLSQTLYLSATEFGLGAFVTAATNEIDAELAFGLDPLVESPLAVLGFGHRGSECTTFELDPNRRVRPEGVPRPQ